MRKAILSLVVAVTLIAGSGIATAGYYVEYYQDNLFLGLAHHRIGCLSDGNTIQSSQNYDGFTNAQYCTPGTYWWQNQGEGSWYDWNYSWGQQQLDSCGDAANNDYGTWGYSERSSTCSYNIWCNCNSDCWIKDFSGREGWTVGISSPCCDHWYCGCF
jgi:hypothetical protein